MSVRQSFKHRLCLGIVLVAGPLMSIADPVPAASFGPMGHCERGLPGPDHGPAGLAGPTGLGNGEPGLGGESDPPPPFMRNVALSEDQQDKVFAILHAAAPALRDHEKAAHKARDALRQLVRAPSFSDNSANQLAQAEGAAESQLALLRTRMEHDLYAVLTPDQQAKVVSMEKDCDFRGNDHGHGGPPHDGAPPR